ncbi:MAG TPA: cyclopropane-fatty-acyl-phospholipid synthase, partial [bacterium]|nr:cyclopropane-fatty-acyl-phospholipid synthase [bacterium]
WFDEELQNHQEHLRIAQHWFLSGRNYRRTLEEWLRRFQAARSVLAHQPGLDAGKLRLWELYLRVCIGLFALHNGAYYGNAQYLLLPR